MTKQEKIQEAYGLHWVIVKDFVDENGWNQKRIFNHQELDCSKYEYEAVGHGVYISRPKSLKGIENNNGWIKIESKSDLPEFGYYEVIQRRNGLASRATLDNDSFTRSNFNYYSHYQEIKEIPKPIY